MLSFKNSTDACVLSKIGVASATPVFFIIYIKDILIETN